MRLEEAGVLADDIHDVTGDDGLVVLPALLLAQSEQILDDRNEEALLLLLGHGPRDRTDGPAKRIEVVPRPCRPVDLLGQLGQHDALGVVAIQVGQEHQRLPHGLVLSDDVGVLGRFADDVAVLVLDDEDLLGLGHVGDHHLPDAGEDGTVHEFPAGTAANAVGRPVAARSAAAEVEDVGPRPDGRLELVLGLVQVLGQHVPRLEADAKDLRVGHLGHADQVEHTGEEGLLTFGRFQYLEMGLEEPRQEQGEALDEDAVVLGPVLKGRTEVGLRGEDAVEAGDEAGEQLPEEGIVLRIEVGEVADLREAFQGIVPKERLGKELVEEGIDELGLKDEAEGDPGEESLEGLEGHPQEARPLAVLEDELAQLVDLGEFRVERFLHLFHLFGHHLIAGEVEDLLRQQLEDLHVVLAQHLRGFGTADEVGDEGRPVVRPLLLEDLDEGEVELGDEHLLGVHGGLVGRHGDDLADDVVLDALPLFWGHHLPSALWVCVCVWVMVVAVRAEWVSKMCKMSEVGE